MCYGLALHSQSWLFKRSAWKKLLNSEEQQKPWRSCSRRKPLTNTAYRQDQEHTANSSTKPAVAWLDMDTVSEKAQGVWFCVTNMHRKQNMNQFCYKARVHAEIHSQLRKVGGVFII